MKKKIIEERCPITFDVINSPDRAYNPNEQSHFKWLDTFTKKKLNSHQYSSCLLFP